MASCDDVSSRWHGIYEYHSRHVLMWINGGLVLSHTCGWCFRKPLPRILVFRFAWTWIGAFVVILIYLISSIKILFYEESGEIESINAVNVERSSYASVFSDVSDDGETIFNGILCCWLRARAVFCQSDISLIDWTIVCGVQTVVCYGVWKRVVFYVDILCQ